MVVNLPRTVNVTLGSITTTAFGFVSYWYDRFYSLVSANRREDKGFFPYTLTDHFTCFSSRF